MQRIEKPHEDLVLPKSVVRLTARLDEFVVSDSKPLGIGKTSEPILVRYTGSDPNIKKFGTDLVLKRTHRQAEKSSRPFQHSLQYEVENIDAINEQFPKVQPQQVIIGASIDLSSAEGIETAIIMPLISYSAEAKPANAYQYLNLAVHNSDPEFSRTRIANTLNDFIHNIQSAVQELHGLGYLHLDGALRNYMLQHTKKEGAGEFAFKLIDLGLSRPIVVEKGLATLLPIEQPLTILDKRALYLENGARRVSIVTDLFQMRCMMLEMVGLAVGLSQNEILGLKDKEGKEIPLRGYEKARRAYASDDELLVCLTNNLIHYLKKRELFEEKAQPLLIWLNAYHPYMTQLPAYTLEEISTKEGALAVAEKDLKQFNKYAKIFAKEIAQAANELSERPPSISRQVSAPFIESEEDSILQYRKPALTLSLDGQKKSDRLFTQRRSSFSELYKFKNLLTEVRETANVLKPQIDFNLMLGFNDILKKIENVNIEEMNQSQCKYLWEEITKIAVEQAKKIHVNKHAVEFYRCIVDENTMQLAELKRRFKKSDKKNRS